MAKLTSQITSEAFISFRYIFYNSRKRHKNITIVTHYEYLFEMPKSLNQKNFNSNRTC